MLAKLAMKVGYRIAANPAILVEAAPILIPVAVFAAAHDAIGMIGLKSPMFRSMEKLPQWDIHSRH